MTTQTGTPKILDGKATAAAIRDEVKAGCAELLAEHNVVPCLTVILVGDDEASHIYVRNKARMAKKIGMRSEIKQLPESVSEAELLSTVQQLGEDSDVHGILVQLPIPKGIDEHRILQAVNPAKDVDGFHPVNGGALLSGMPGFVPCTPAGIIEMLKRNDIEMSGKHAVVIGRSNIVGKPMSLLLLRENCTVTICHSRTVDLPKVAAQADILVAAVGRPGMVTADFIKPGAAVIDVGIHKVKDEAECRRLYGDDEARLKAVRDKGATLVGDVHPVEARTRAGWFSPVPGGVGPLTIALLMRNTLEAARNSVASK